MRRDAGGCEFVNRRRTRAWQVKNRYARARRGQRVRVLAAEASGAAGDDGDVAGQVEKLLDGSA
jgi:hypothetical protein